MGKEKPKTIPFIPGVPPPIGWVQAYCPETGEHFWIDPLEAAATSSKVAKHVLTEEQEGKIKRCHWALKEHDNRPLTEWYDNFAADDTPDREINIYESIVAAYKQELNLRPGCSKQERRLLYIAIMAASLAGSVDNVLATNPQVKALPHLARAVAAFHYEREKNPPAIHDGPHKTHSG